MMTEYHCHVLPGIDDGAKDTDTALAMIEMLRSQGVERMIVTPHFYAHRERSVEDYLEKRRLSFEKIRGKAAVRDIRLGAEVAIEHGISEIRGIEKLAAEGTDMILLELPYRGYSEWMSEEIYNISAEFGLTVMLAHVHRYLEYYSCAEMENILGTDAVLQVNIEAFENRKEKKLVKRLIKEGRRLAFGSDCHNLSGRKPNWDLLRKKCSPELIAASDSILDMHIRG